ncbi:hypothetical protein MTR62_03760 [Novosphingobium sp. 1949]|uniref:Uncharacterized protein n=1 Tax=Novosphingobium organovorum TaxID=2930092 RepID=A0ABT0B9S6_9SPHN|nr:hypothetical protein [Novosphingobium organovorum]MCJ2181825.1 hypothetical protein [Novosphingobium organovorum]
MSRWSALLLLLPATALAGCDRQPAPKPLVVTTDGKAIAQLCSVPVTMFAGTSHSATVTLRSDLTRAQLECTLREVRRSLPDARIVSAGSSNPASSR